jgi:hypothetical protein
MKILAKLEKSFDSWFLITISFIFFLLRLPSLFEPDWYGDEGIYQVLGIGIKAGRLLYRDIFDNKPPLLYLLYSFVSSDQFLIRLISLIFGLVSVWAFFYLARRLFENPRIAYISTSIFAVLFGLPLIEGNIANAENFMLPLNIIAGFLVLKSLDIKSRNTKYMALSVAGFIIGLSFLFKIVAVFDFAAFFAFLFFTNYSKKLLDIFKPKNLIAEIRNLFPLTIGFMIPIVITALFFLLNHAFPNFLTATLFSNIGYVGYGNKLIIPQGFLILKLILLGTFSLFIFYRRKHFGNSFVFVSLWLAFSLFNAFFSQRPYTHYVLVLLPAFCLMIGLFLLNKNFSKLSGILIITSFIVILLGFTFYIKTVLYYPNFISFVIDGNRVNSYQKFFDASTPINYDLANYINTHASPKDNIFLWGNNAQVYYLTAKLPPGKYAAAYHITSYKDGYMNTKEGLALNKPKFIVIMPNAGVYPFSLTGYNQEINIENVIIYEKINQ